MSRGRVTRLAVFAASAVALAWGSVGCSSFRQEWPTRRMAKEHKPTDEGPITFAPDAEQDVVTSKAVDGLPAGVQSAFRHDHPGVAVTSVKQIPNGSGLMLYRIAYLDEGVASSATYRAGGKDFSPAGEPGYVVRPDDTGRPAAKFAPAGGPATQPVADSQLIRVSAEPVH